MTFRLFIIKKIQLRLIFILIGNFSSFGYVMGNQINEDTSRINITWNRNLETIALIYNLSEAGDLLFEKNPPPRAGLSRLLTSEFAQYKNHKAVLLLNALINENFVDLYDIDLSLYLTDLPDFKQYADFPEVYYEYDDISKGEVQKRFDEFHNAVREFYIDADLENYFTSEKKSLYDKLMKEVSTVAPSARFIQTAEKYYGIQHFSYNIVVSVFSFNGIGRSKTIKTCDGENVYQFVSSDPNDESQIINLDDLNSFQIGYTNKEYFREIAVHELIHSFYAESIRSNRSIINLINELNFLYHDTLIEKMKSQGYMDWQMCFEEHLVRLGEIKIAREIGDNDFAQDYYNQCVNVRGFEYLPQMDSLFEVYENNRKNYPAISSFLPDLIGQMRHQ